MGVWERVRWGRNSVRGFAYLYADVKRVMHESSGGLREHSERQQTNCNLDITDKSKAIFPPHLRLANANG